MKLFNRKIYFNYRNKFLLRVSQFVLKTEPIEGCWSTLKAAIANVLSTCCNFRFEFELETFHGKGAKEHIQCEIKILLSQAFEFLMIWRLAHDKNSKIKTNKKETHAVTDKRRAKSTLIFPLSSVGVHVNSCIDRCEHEHRRTVYWHKKII